MELRINIAFVVILGIAALCSRAESPTWLHENQLGSPLVAAEDDFFRELGEFQELGQDNQPWTKTEALRELLAAYVDSDEPALAVALAGRARAASRRDPYVTYQLARAYGKLGRFEDAADASRLARARCEDEMYAGSGRTPYAMRTPCTVRQFVVIDAHTRAMERLRRWNVVDPHDPRVAQAFSSVQRNARVALVDGGL